MPLSFKPLAAQTSNLLRTGHASGAAVSQEAEDARLAMPKAQWDLAWVARNAELLVGRDGVDDAYLLKAAESMRPYLADALGNPGLAILPLRAFNEGNLDFKSGRAALVRMTDLAKRTASADPNSPEEQAAAQLDQTALNYGLALQTAKQTDGEAFDQDRFDTDYAIKMGLLPEFARDLLTDDERERYEAAERYAREGQRATPQEGAASAAQGGEDPRLNQELRLDLAKRTRADIEQGAIARAARKRLHDRINASMAQASWTRLHDTLSPEANELITRAFIAGQEGIDIDDDKLAAVSPDNPKQGSIPGAPGLGDIAKEHRRLQAQWEADNGRVKNLSNATLKARLRPGEAETVRNLMSLARGVVNDPQWWTDTWNALKLATDRTLGNPLRLIADVASDIGTPIGDFIAGRDFDHEAYSEAKRQEIIEHNLWEAATQPLAYDDYGFFLGGLQGAIEQLPIWGVLATGAGVSALTKSTIGLNAAQTFLALGYAQDTRNAAIEQGADAWQANLLGLTSGFVQGFLDRAQGEALVGKGFSEAYLKAALKDASQVFGAAIARNELVKHGTARMARATLRFGGALALDGFAESVVEGTQAAVDRLGQNLALKLSGEDKAAFDKVLASFKEEFVEAIPTMIVTVGVAGTGRAIRGTAQHASIGKQIRILTSEASKDALKALPKKSQADVLALRQRWRDAANDKARVAILRDEGKVSQSQAETLHAYFLAEERIADRNDVAAMQLGVNMASEWGLDFAANDKSAGQLARVLQSIGLKDVQVREATLRTNEDLTHKGAQRGWAVSFVPPGATERVTLALGILPQRLATPDASAASASSVLEYLKTAAPAALDGMEEADFIARWQADADFRDALIERHGLGTRGTSLGLTLSDGPVLTFVDSKGNNQTLSSAGLILLATGGHGAKVVAANATLAHETAHAVVSFLRETGALTEASPEVALAREVYGNAREGVDELFNEEVLADALAREADLGLAAAETAAGMLTRRRVGGLAAVFERLANWFLGNGDILLQSEDGAWTGMDEDAARSGVVRFASRSPGWILSRLTRHANDAVKAFASLEDARRTERLERLRQQVRAIRQELNARRDQSAVMEDAVADAQAAEAHEQAREETRRLLAEEDAALREQAQVLDEQARARLADARTTIADAREAFAEAWRQPLPEGANAQRTEANRRRQLLADWRAAKDAELAILRERAAIGLDPDARREYLEADLRERARLDGRALREQADKERRAIDDAAPSQGDALLGQNRIIGHETIESREHYVRRQMAANGWTRKRALAESTHLYPEDMAALATPWLARALYAEGGTSPDAAAQAAHDAGRLAEPTVDAFWDAVRGDVSAVTQWKEREKARVDAETAHAARWGAERFRKDLAALADRDAQGRLSIGGGYLDDWSVRAQDAFNRGLRTEAQIAERLGIPYGAWMTHHPLGGRGEDTITGVVGEDGRDIRASDLLDLSHEWHHVGRRFDEALFLDPNDFPDVRTPADIDDKQTAALFFYYTRMREAPREVNRASLTAEERDALTQRERPVWEAFARTVAPARDAFVRAIAAEAEPDTLRPLAEAYANAMRAHKRLADDATKQFLASIGKPRAYLNERPHRAGSVRYSVGSVDGALPTRTPLVAMHFLSSKHLAAALKRKGLPTPSIAVTRDNATWQLPNSYGDSVLFFKQGTVDPKANPRNLLFPGDAMTQRYPQNAVKKGGLDNIMRTLDNMGWEKLDEAEVRKEALILALLQNDRETAEDIETPALFAAWVYGQTGEKLTTPEAVRAYAERFRDAETGAIEPVIETTDTWGGVYQRNFFKDAPRHIVYTGRAPTGAKAAQEAFDATGVKFRPGAYPIDDQAARRNLAYAALFTLGDIESARTAIANATKRPYEDWKQAPMRLIDAVSKDGVPRDVSLRKFINDLSKETTLDGALALFNGENRWYNTTPEARQALLDLVQFYKDAERDYYEAKPRRIVGTDEIALALIPASEITLRRELENHGIPYETYNASSTHALEETSDVAKNAIARARFQIGGLYSGASMAYDRPSLKAVGSNTGSLAYGWGLYATTYKYAAMSYAQEALHEQVWWINRPEGDESHLLVWDKPISQENRERWLAAITSLGLDPRELAHFSYGEDWATHEMTGRQAYDFVEAIARYIIENAHPKQFASTLLARFDIDGMKVGNIYVAFSDEHLQVVRRWVWDPQTQDFALDTTFLPPTPAPRRSIGGWLEQATEAHLAAEREGDVETAQRLVYEAADRAEYRYKAAHGTGHFGFTVFDPNKSDDKRSLFFAGDPTLAATYQWQATDISGYGSANTAFRDVASTIRPLELDLNAEYPNDAAFIHAVTEAVERAGGTVSVGHLEPGSGGTVEVAPHEHITLKPWPQDYILVTMPRSDGPKAFDILTPDTMVREAKALNAAKEEELRGYAARLKAEYEADPNGEYFGAFGRMSKKDRWLQAEHTLQNFLGNPQLYLRDERLFAAQSAAIKSIRISWEFYRRNDSFGIYHVALRMDNPLVIDAQGGNWSAIDIKLPGSNRKHWKTRQLAEYAQTHGYDGVQINNVYDLGPNYIPGAGRKPSSVYIVFDGKQVKSLDPFTYDDRGNLIPLSERFDTAQPDIRLSVGGENPQATPARQKKAHGAYPDLGDAIASARFSVGAKRKQEYRALIVKTRPNLPQEDVDTFMRELDTLNDTKAEKAALHWFVKGALILPEDREKLDMAVRMSGKWHLDFQAFDTPAALINEANARAEAKKKKPALAYLDPDTVPQLTNKRDLGHGVVIYDVEDSPAGQQAMRQIMNSHLGRNADGEFWSPWCLLTCSPKTGALSESSRKYWEHYDKTGRAAAFHNGKLCAFQSSDTKQRQWWDLEDKSHGANIPIAYSVRARDAWQTDTVPEEATTIIRDEIDETSGSVVHSDPDEKAIIGDRQNGPYQEWMMVRGRPVLTYDGHFKNGKANGPSTQRAYAPISGHGAQRVARIVSDFVGDPGLLTAHAEFKDGALTKPAKAIDEQGRLWHLVEPQDSTKAWRYVYIVGQTPWMGDPRIVGITLRVVDSRNVRTEFDFLTGRERGYVDDPKARHISEVYPDLAELYNFPPKGETRKAWTASRLSVGGNARYARADFVARATPIANDPSVKERSAHYVPIGDVPDALVRHGATPGGLITTDGKVAKIARRHDLPPERLADAIEAMNDPVAIFLEWEDAARGTIGLSVLTDVLADDGEGRQAPVRLTLITRTDAPGMFLTSAYARKRSKEHNYVKVVANGGLLYVDEQRVAQLPLEDATVSACVPSNVRGGPSTGTVPNREEEVKENVRRAIGGVERERRVGAAAALYYGRSPAVADVATAAIVELALLAEADRSGKRYSTQDIKDAYADFGIHADDRTAAAIADRLNDNAKAERWGRRSKEGISQRDLALQQAEHLRRHYDLHWTQAQKDAFEHGVAGGFGAARELARDAQEIAEAKRAEAEGVLGVAPTLIEAELGFDITTTLLATVRNPEEQARALTAAQRRERERERKRALEEAEQAMQAMEDGTASPEPTPESLGFSPEKMDALRKRRDELRKRLTAIERQEEAARKARIQKAKKDGAGDNDAGKAEAKQEDKDEEARLASIHALLGGIAFDLDNPTSVRELVNLIILHVAERRLGRELKTRADTREAFRDPLVVRDAARTLAQMTAGIATERTYSARRERALQAANRLASAETIRQVRSLATYALLTLREALIRETPRQIRDEIVKAIDAVAPRTPFAVGKEDSERKVTGSLEQRLREIRRALLLGETARLRLRNEMTELLAGTRKEAQDRGEDEEALDDYRDYINAQRTLAALNQAGDWRHMALSELAALRDEVLALIERGQDAHDQRMEAFQERCERLIQPILAALDQNPPDVKPGDHSPLAQRIAALIDRNLGLQHLLFETLLGNSTGETRAKAKVAIDQLSHLFSEAAVTYEANRVSWQKAIGDLIEKHYGSTRTFNARMDTVIPEEQRKLISDRMTDARADKPGARPPQRTQLTIGQVFQLYASAIQKDYAKNIRLHHRDGASFEAMRQVLADEDLAFLRDCSAFFRSIFPKLRDEYEAITGVRVGTTPDYWPVKIDYRTDGLSTSVRAFTPIVSAMEPRRRNNLDFREDADMRTMLYGRLDDWAHMVGYGRLGLIARTVLGNRSVKRAAQNSLGDKLAKRIEDNVNDALLGPEAKGGDFEGWLLRAARWTSYFALAGNIGSLIKQFAGVPAFALEMGIADVVKAATAAKDDAWRADWQYLTQGNPAYDARYGAGLNAEMRKANIDFSRAGVHGAVAYAARFGMYLQGVTDRLVARPFVVHAFRAYRDAYLRQGMDEAEAKRRASIDAWAMVERTQSSARAESQLQSVNRSAFARLFTQFLSSPLQQLQYEARALSACLKGEEGAKRRLIRALVINHVLTPLFWTALDAVVRGLIFGGFFDDDDERKERLLLSLAAEATAGVILGQGTAIPVFGWGAEWAIGVFYGAERPRQDDLAAAMGNIPAISTTARAMWFAGNLLYDLSTAPWPWTDTEWAEVLSDLDDAAKTTTPIYRQLNQAARGWLGHDLDDWWEED